LQVKDIKKHWFVRIRTLVTLVGRSGVTHSFTETSVGPNGRRVVESFGRQLTELDIIGVYAKVIDVEACLVELEAPSCTPEARELAKSYGVILRLTAKPSR